MATSAKKGNGKLAGVGDEAVLARTGKRWSEWLGLLDGAGARKMTHAAIARLLREEHGLPGWWAQMVAVGYEQARGLRARYEKPGGYEISGSKTVAVPVGELYRAWKDERTRNRWLPGEEIEIRRATPNRSLRITWSDGATHVDAHFYPRGPDRSQVSVQHKKLKSARAAERQKKLWAGRLASLKERIES